MIRVFEILKSRKYFSVFLVSTIAMLIAYPYLQSFGNVDIWFQVIEIDNIILYLSFSVLFGLLVSMQAHSISMPKACRLQSGSLGTAGTIAGFFVAQCPSCAVLLSLFLPFNAIIFIVTYNTWLTLGTIALMLLAIHLLGGFKNANA